MVYFSSRTKSCLEAQRTLKWGRGIVVNVQALRFGERCANVVNRTSVTARTLQEMLEALDIQIETAEEEVRKNERWEMRRVVRADLEGDESINTTVLVGAGIVASQLAIDEQEIQQVALRLCFAR